MDIHRYQWIPMDIHGYPFTVKCVCTSEQCSWYVPCTSEQRPPFTVKSCVVAICFAPLNNRLPFTVKCVCTSELCSCYVPCTSVQQLPFTVKCVCTSELCSCYVPCTSEQLYGFHSQSSAFAPLNCLRCQVHVTSEQPSGFHSQSSAFCTSELLGLSSAWHP